MDKFEEFKRRLVSKTDNSKKPDGKEEKQNMNEEKLSNANEILSYEDERKSINDNLGLSLNVDIASLERNQTIEKDLFVYSDISQKVVAINSEVIVINLDDFRHQFLDLLAKNKIRNVMIFGEATTDFFYLFENLFSFVFRNIFSLDYENIFDIVVFEDTEERVSEKDFKNDVEGTDVKTDHSQENNNKFMEVYEDMTNGKDF